MARTNACSELRKFWLQTRHECLVDEGVPVRVPRGQSDIDIVAMRSALTPFNLPTGIPVGPRVIVETKDEHDWDASGREFARSLRSDIDLMAGGWTIPLRATAVKFTMLRQEHFERATALFGTRDFERIFVVHALDPAVRSELEPRLVAHRIHWVTIREVVADLVGWYRQHPRPSGLRHSSTGDMLHLLIGFCGLTLD